MRHNEFSVFRMTDAAGVAQTVNRKDRKPADPVRVPGCGHSKRLSRFRFDMAGRCRKTFRPIAMIMEIQSMAGRLRGWCVAAERCSINSKTFQFGRREGSGALKRFCFSLVFILLAARYSQGADVTNIHD